MLEAAAAEISAALDQGELPLLTASDCSICIATLPTVARRVPGVRFLWIDAHGDFNTPETTPSGFLGGMCLGAACGRWDAGWPDTIDPSRCAFLGVRDLDPGEKVEVEAAGVRDRRAGGRAGLRAPRPRRARPVGAAGAVPGARRAERRRGARRARSAGRATAGSSASRSRPSRRRSTSSSWPASSSPSPREREIAWRRFPWRTSRNLDHRARAGLARGQGPVRHRRRAHHVRVADLRRPRARRSPRRRSRGWRRRATRWPARRTCTSSRGASPRRIAPSAPCRTRSRPGRIAGGSSGGCGAALAAGLVDVRARDRLGRLDPDPGRVLRRGRLQADATASCRSTAASR